MSKDYLDIPSYICISDIIDKDFSLSAQQYKKVIIKNENCKKISELLEHPLISGKEVGSNNYIEDSEYIFVRTKSIQQENFCINLDIKDSNANITPKSYSDNVGKSHERSFYKGDILFVTGGSVGEVAYVNQGMKHSIISSHILRLIFKENKYYIFAFLKSNILKEQVNTAPSGGIKGLDTFKDSYLLNAKIPFPKDDITIKYVESIVQAIINKEIAIKIKHKRILNQIQRELEDNQGTNTFLYSLPTINEIIEIDRMDSCLYSKDFKKKEFLITNYKHGTSTVKELGFEISRGQNLQVSNIGKSIQTKEKREGYYTLILPKFLSKYGTVDTVEYIGNRNKLKKLEYGDIIFGAEGNEKGRSLVIIEKQEMSITNIHGITLNQNSHNITNGIFVKLFLDYYRDKGMIDAYAVGGNGGSLAIKYWDFLKFPNFPKEKEKEIVKSYHNKDMIYNPSKCTIDDFIEYDNDFNKNAGIYELDKSMKLLKIRLDEIIDIITNDEKVNITFKL